MKRIGTAVYSIIESLTHQFLSVFTEVHLETIHIQLFSMVMDTDTVQIQVDGYH